MPWECDNDDRKWGIVAVNIKDEVMQTVVVERKPPTCYDWGHIGHIRRMWPLNIQQVLTNMDVQSEIASVGKQRLPTKRSSGKRIHRTTEEEQRSNRFANKGKTTTMKTRNTVTHTTGTRTTNRQPTTTHTHKSLQLQRRYIQKTSAKTLRT